MTMYSFIETRLFNRLVQEYLTDDAYSELQRRLIARPECGPVIPGSGGVRKLRWAAPGRGKRGGYRVIYYLRKANGVIWMKMPRPKRNIGREILSGLRELKGGEHGRVINVPNVAAVRAKTGLSQSQFAGCVCAHSARLGTVAQGAFGRCPDATAGG
jgi:mRNA-degrading endonuclease RelE of RelBE toxin-antitoxin system